MRDQLKYALLLLVFFLSSNLAFSIHTPKHPSLNKTGIERVYENISINDFLKKDRRQIEAQIGQKLTFKERLQLSFVQKSIRKAARKGESKKRIKERLDSEEFDINPGALILGLLLGLLGVIGVYIFFDEDVKQARKSTWIGYGMRVLIVLIFISIIVRTLTV